jgi:hypothetical protein
MLLTPPATLERLNVHQGSVAFPGLNSEMKSKSCALTSKGNRSRLIWAAARGGYHGGAMWSALLAERLFLCDDCGERIKKMCDRLREQGAIPKGNPATTAVAEKLGVN